MHSSLRKELCGTRNILQSVRTRSSSRPSTRTRRFSTRTYLLSQSNSKDGSASCSGSNSKSTESSSDTQPNSSAKIPKVDPDLEKWFQAHGNEGPSTVFWDFISRKDENGKRKLLPQVKNILDELASDATSASDSQLPSETVTERGRTRSATSNEPKNENNLALNKDGARERLPLRSKNKSDATPTRDAAELARASESSEGQHHNAVTEQDGLPLRNSAPGANEPPPSVDNIPVSKFHGSSAARRQRSRQKEKAQVTVLPEWFNKHNVTLRGDKRTQSTIDASVQTTQEAGEKSDESVENTVLSITAELDQAQVVKQTEKDKTEDLESTQKQQTQAAGPPGSGSNNNSASPSIFDKSSTDDTPTLVALPSTKGRGKKRHYIQAAQRTELILTAEGRLKLPAGGSAHSRQGGIRSHLLVHYTATRGDIFLDRLIEDVATQLQSNLITLDAQDISALISKADIDPMIANEARLMSYEIFDEIFKEDSPEEGEPSIHDEIDMGDPDEEGGPGGPQGIPFMVGKPITIDLKALFGPRNSRRGRDPFGMGPKDMMPFAMDRQAMSKGTPHIFHSLVDSILSSPSYRQKAVNAEASEQPKDNSLKESQKDATSQPASQGATIIHVKDLKTIQDNNVGKQFLTQLYEQVDRRRSNGEAIMLIGTSCERGEVPTYDAGRIERSQVSELDEISSTILITPAIVSTKVEYGPTGRKLPDLHRDLIPIGDWCDRIQVINARHLYEMLQSKEIQLDQLKEGFWTRPIGGQVHPLDDVALCDSYWSYSYVQRLAAILASSELSQSKHPIHDAVQILEQSDKLKNSWAMKVKSNPRPSFLKKDAKEEEEESEISRLAEIRSKATKHEKKLLSGVIEPKKIRTTFKDIHIPAETVEALQTLTTLSLVRPDAFKYGVLASDRIPGLLLYGPPGTGKTLAAKAVARESGATMLEVSAADINDMYVGEGEKNVKALFSLAKKLSPCVVFLDEADAMFSARSNAGRRVSHRELLNQFLKEWDGMSNDSGSAFIMVATNRPMDLDDAVLRRLPRRLLVDLPAEKDRLEILKIHLRNEIVADDVDLAKLASRTQFYSGSDLKNVAVAAALNCVREENALAKAHTGTEPYVHAERRTLTMKHFDSALEDISASISEDMASLREIKKFDKQYGDRKGRKRTSPKWGFKTAAEADAVLDTVKVRS